MLVQRAVGKGNYRYYRFDGESIIAAWPLNSEPSLDRNPEERQKIARPSEFKGDQRKAWLAAMKKFEESGAKSFNHEQKSAEAKESGQEITLRQASRIGWHAKPMVALIRKSDEKYRFDRHFMEPTTKEHGGIWKFNLNQDGIYHVTDRNSRGAKREYFLHVKDGKAETISREDVELKFPAIERKQLAGGDFNPSNEYEELVSRKPTGVDLDDWLSDNDAQWMTPIVTESTREDF